MTKSKKLAALREILGEYRVKGDEHVFFCPRHPARTGRRSGQLSVNLATDMFHCWTCGWGHRSSLEPILRMRRESELYAEYVASRPLAGEAEKRREVVHLPAGFRPLSEASGDPSHARAMAYLARRGVTSEDIGVHKLGYVGTNGDWRWRDRIVFPSFDRYGELNFVTGRAIGSQQPKYLHSTAAKDEIIFNEYLVDWDQPVTLVEGPIDAIKGGPNCIPVQGTQLSVGSRLLSAIVATQSYVFMALDSDARHQERMACANLLRHGVGVRVMRLGHKDPGEMTPDEFAACRKLAHVLNSEVDSILLGLVEWRWGDGA